MDLAKAAVELSAPAGPIKALRAVMKSLDKRNVDLTGHPAAPAFLLAIVSCLKTLVPPARPCVWVRPHAPIST